MAAARRPPSAREALRALRGRGAGRRPAGAAHRSLGLLLLVSAVALAGCPAAARVLPVRAAPGPVATIDMPDDWSAQATADGVEGESPGDLVRVAARFVPAPDADAASAAALAELSRRELVAAAGAGRASARRLGGPDAVRLDFSGRDAGGETDIVLVLTPIPRRGGFVVLAIWGDDEAQEALGNDLQRIADSLSPSP